MAVQTIRGLAVGRRFCGFGDVDGVVLHLQGACGDGEIAANAFVFIDLAWEGHARARYLSWVNLHDIEHAARREPGRWTLADPAAPEVHDADWRPFGWGAPPFPNVANADRDPCAAPANPRALGDPLAAPDHREPALTQGVPR